MRYTNKRIELIAIDEATLTIAIAERRNNGYDLIPGSIDNIVLEGIKWFYCLMIRKEDMRYKVSGI
jgi:hypothetical protein